MDSDHEKALNIAFIHPDLGIGGAERLVVDAAIGLQECGHKVTIYTSHCDKTHCFEEVKNEDLKVVVLGEFLPTNFMGKFFILFANLKQFILVLNLVMTGAVNKYDLFIVDQLPTCVPFLHFFGRYARTLFYCHFPDQLLAQKVVLLKRLYRIPFDLLEQFTMAASDLVVVNSNFTKSIFFKTFRYLRMNPNVVYPCVELASSPICDNDIALYDQIIGPGDRYYLSLNRFERKKDVMLAIEAYSMSNQSKNKNSKLLICGGYDERVHENVEYLKELQKACEDLNLSHATIFYKYFSSDSGGYQVPKGLKFKRVIFMTSISSSLKELLLQRTEMLLYTPSFEHFGIVPLEAMKNGIPVLAVNNGGPVETVVSLEPGVNDKMATGWLRPQDARQWADVLDESVVYTSENTDVFSNNGPERIREHFSRDAMTESFLLNIENMFMKERRIQYWAVITTMGFNTALHLLVHSFGSSYSFLYILIASTFLLRSNFALGLYWILAFFLQGFL
ncbi:GDP-Man:Man(1)GlcNAc(2)-PP-dolichol alpha-1,3-mannosyltransferase Ecym_2197 [Eremothecium cymbalariae DBVPG|uniref:Alpha-1,3/1,6-mannosyltransferase ALG2 n=1 Tax=Eremothecium cymbalariae (strain CBS 270.75 / DBVPG 7215 / KCTC 17166 / NRRL Y-17582) TaxID=931890 RepID=G8JP41_ERECY|nr:Hypothetical protein Ecym_2197 [Eremothecium cymbalariae DBVPG\